MEAGATGPGGDPAKQRTPKQAVVLIHGIGEQIPMDTLRGFVRAVWTTNDDVIDTAKTNQVWSKPDNVSQNYELRRLTTDFDRNGRRTDFFELYWADLMTGTQVRHLTAWLKLLLFRSPRQVPRQLLGLWSTIALLSVAVPLVLILWKFGLLPVPGWVVAAASSAGTVAWFLAGGLLVDVAGDAARYLHVAPPNIARRRRVRDAGIRLLRRLHSSGDYDRIIVVGHSLGSVIGYDVLTHLWPRYNTGHAAAASGGPQRADPLEQLAAKPDLGATEYQDAQEKYAERLRGAGNKWLVTDFVTVGSPLAHASFLMARDDSEFRRKRVERELPACPPILEEIDGQLRFCYSRGGTWLPHHAAVFGPTRWTNLYFPCEGTIVGDVIGGPVHKQFGHGVQDIAVHTTIKGGYLTHTDYWNFPSGWRPGDPAPSHIAALRKALRLG